MVLIPFRVSYGVDLALSLSTIRAAYAPGSKAVASAAKSAICVRLIGWEFYTVWIAGAGLTLGDMGLVTMLTVGSKVGFRRLASGHWVSEQNWWLLLALWKNGGPRSSCKGVGSTQGPSRPCCSGPSLDEGVWQTDAQPEFGKSLGGLPDWQPSG
eukprot:2774286-Amphidinium_carterae.1